MIKLYIKKYKNKERFVLRSVTPPPFLIPIIMIIMMIYK